MALFIFLMLVPVSFAQESQTDSSDDINATILSDSLQTSDISAVEDADELKLAESHSSEVKEDVSSNSDIISDDASLKNRDLLSTKIPVAFAANVIIDSNNVVINISSDNLINESIQVDVNNESHVINMVNGKASLELSDLKKGKYTAIISIINSAEYSAQASLPFEIEGVKTRFHSNNITVIENQNANFKIQLVDDKSIGIADKQVIFTIDGLEKKEAVTDSQGYATIQICLEGGKHTITTSFNGDDTYISTILENKVTAKYILTAQIDITKQLNNVTVDITLSRPVTLNMTAHFDNKDKLIKVVNGKATLELPNIDYGTYTIGLYLDNEEYYMASYSEDVVIEVVQTRMSAADLQTTEFSNEGYSIRLTENGNKALSNKKVTFTLNGKVYEVLTDSRGYAKLNINLTAGSYKITTKFDGEGLYLPVSSTNTIDVKAKLHLGGAIKMDYNNVTIDIELSKSIDADFEAEVNGKTYNLHAVKGKTKLVLNNLENGRYVLQVIMKNSELYEVNGIKTAFVVNVTRPEIIINDFETSEHSNESMKIRLVDEDNRGIFNGTMIVTIDGNGYKKITDNEGYVSMPIDLDGGNHKISVQFIGDDVLMPASASANILVKSVISSEILVSKNSKHVQIRVNLSKDISADLTVIVNGKSYKLNSKDILKLDNLEDGKYNVSVSLNDDKYVFIPSDTSFTVSSSQLSSQILAQDMTIYYSTEITFKARLVDSDGAALAGKTLRYILNGKESTIVTDSLGTASVPVESAVGEYEIELYFDGDESYTKSSSANKITVKTSIILPSQDVYTLNAPYALILLDENGNASTLKGSGFFVDDLTGNLIPDSDGVVTLTIGLDKGVHSLKIINHMTGEVKTHKITVLDRLSQNKDITMYYGAGKYYKVKVLDDYGQPADGVNINIKIGSTSKTVKTDGNGYASIKITQKPGKYSVTATYKGFKVSNKVTVKTTLVTKNIAVKKGKTIKFTAKLLNSNGKILKNKKVTFKFSGKTYKIKTDSKGIATLKVTNKKLKVGKYTIKTTYGKLTNSNKITIKK
ncbi:hypothetical protein [uncultured Methanobrevibacter sp.]|uniref:hypothetical protein n=1 Tax=uncultured Methanobrevibacter sp. TaxID=253161 RepID=UPI0025E9ECE8|nr:hypothetical protein [uncultured Methanobrevibacter sp.]